MRISKKKQLNIVKNILKNQKTNYSAKIILSDKKIVIGLQCSKRTKNEIPSFKYNDVYVLLRQ